VRFLRAAAALPIGPSLDQRHGLFGRTDRPSLYKRRAKSRARKKPFGINRKKLIAAFGGRASCCCSLQHGKKPAASLCNAKK
jgi:hypothetical protein